MAALEQTFNEIVRRHESLRTTFVPVDGNPVQVIAPSLTLTLEIVDLSGLDEDEREAKAMQRVADDGRQPFDLMNGPLLRPVLIKLAGDEHLLLFSMHHIISDVWSRGVLIRELQDTLPGIQPASNLRHCRSFPYSMRISHRGRDIGFVTKRSSLNWPTGSNNLPVLPRCWNYRQTALVRRCNRSMAATRASYCRPVT